MTTRTEVVELMSSILRENLNEPRNKISSHFKRVITSKGYEGHLDCVLEAFFRLEFPRVQRIVAPRLPEQIKKNSDSKPQRRQKKELLLQEIKKKIVVNIFEYVTLIGKPLKDCTGRECAQMGGFYRDVADGMEAYERVEDAYTASQLVKLLEERQKVRTRSSKLDVQLSID